MSSTPSPPKPPTAPPPPEAPPVLYCDDCGAPGAKLWGITHWKLTDGKRGKQEARLNRRLCAQHEGFRRQDAHMTLGDPDPDPESD